MSLNQKTFSGGSEKDQLGVLVEFLKKVVICLGLLILSIVIVLMVKSATLWVTQKITQGFAQAIPDFIFMSF